ncbi:MAG: hypothetical protein WBC06_11690 [Chitinophagaceae bacterium]
MTNYLKKTFIQLLPVLFLLTFAFVACNNKGGEKKEATPDTAVIKAVEPTQPADTTKKDSVAQKPIKTPD